MQCSPGSRLSFGIIEMIIRHFWRILLAENEKFSLFTKRDADIGSVKGPKTAVFGGLFFSDGSRNFSMGDMVTFKVFKMLLSIRAF